MKKHFLLAAVISMLAVPASAQGFYILGDLGQSKMKVDFTEVDEDGEYSVHLNEKDNAFGFGGGYSFNPYLALEVAYRDFGSISDGESIEYMRYSQKTEFTAFQVSVLGKIPVNALVDIYGRLGAARVKTKSVFDVEVYPPYSYLSYSETESQSKTRAVFGLGVSFNVNESVAVRAEYNQFAKLEELKLSSLTAGVTYSF